MTTITRFVLHTKSHNLTIETNQQEQWQLSYEYLRFFSPAQIASKQVIGNKKLVQLNTIENVGKHGFRLNFDDNHSCIFTFDDFVSLTTNQERNWQKYEELLSSNKMTREAKIDIVNLS